MNMLFHGRGAPIRILTFDIEEWYQILDHPAVRSPVSWSTLPSRIEGSTQRILDVLDAHDQKATFFCLGWIAERYPKLIKDIVNRGHEIGSHSYHHQLAYEQGPNDFRRDLQKSIHILEDLSGEKIVSYRVPGFSVTKDNPWVFDILIECGIRYDCSIFAARRAHGGFPDMPSTPFILRRHGGSLKAFPMNAFPFMGRKLVFSGGGYFRLMHYGIIRQLTKRSGYVMTYFHPRDFDAEQPMIPGLGKFREFKSYVGIKGALSKLDKLLSEFEFHSLLTADQMLDEDQMPVIEMP